MSFSCTANHQELRTVRESVVQNTKHLWLRLTRLPRWANLRRVLDRVVFVVCVAVGVLFTEPSSAMEPFTYIYDAPSAACTPLSAEGLSKKAGWSRLAEDDTTHHFQGCVVFMNDKIVAVMPPDALDLDVYSRQTQRLRRCTHLTPIFEDDAVRKRTSLAIRENTASSVSIDVECESAARESCHVTYELTVGAAFIETTASKAVKKLRVQARCRFAVLPDFFGDDIVIDASEIPVSRVEIPSENFLLHMMHDGEAIVMTVSESRDNDIRVRLSDTQPRTIISSDITYGSKQKIWVAILAGKGIWHEHTIDLQTAGQEIPLDWKMPFPGLWRVDWSTVDKLTDSWEMLLQDPEGHYVMQNWFGQDASLGQRFGERFSDRDWNKPGRKRWNPVLGSFRFPCWVDQDRRGYLQPLQARRYVSRGQTYNFSGPAIVYPLDRVQTAPFRTPIEKLTVVDLVRMTLGVGPCQYILDLEGQKKNAQGVATCYARDVICAVYKAGTQLQNGSVIEEHLAAAVAFIRNVRERIDAYVEFGHEMTAYLDEQKRLNPQHAEFLDELLLITKRLDQFFDAQKERMRTPEYAAQAAKSFRKNLLTNTHADAYEKCATQMRVFTSIGGAQDGLVAACRMIVKRLRQRAGIAMAVNPELKEIGTEIRTRTQAMLRNPTPYEAPRH